MNLHEQLAKVSEEVTKRTMKMLESAIEVMLNGGRVGLDQLELVSVAGCTCRGIKYKGTGLAFWATVQFTEDEISVRGEYGPRCPHMRRYVP